MARETLYKFNASREIEALLSDVNHSNQDNWLLSYLDVFVLIIMLVITLLALTDFNTDPKIEIKKITPKKTLSLKTKTKPIKSIVKMHETSKNSLASPVEYAQIKIPNTKIKKTTLLKPNPALDVANNNDATQVTQVNKLDNMRSQIQPVVQKNVDDKSKNNKLIIPKSKNTISLWQKRLKNNLEHFKLNQFINIKVREGYAQIEIQDNVLFDSAQAQLTEEGKDLLEKLTALLKQSAGLIFVEGHTDNQPIATKNFPSNWELGSARATSVLHFLITQGIKNQRLRAVTYADTMPIADNNTIEGRKKNRRVNLLVKIPDQNSN